MKTNKSKKKPLKWTFTDWDSQFPSERRAKCLFLGLSLWSSAFWKTGLFFPSLSESKSPCRQSLFISSLRMWSESPSGGASLCGVFRCRNRVYLVLRQSATCDKPQTFQASWRKGSLIAASWERSLPSSDQVGAIEREMSPLRGKVWGCNSWKQGEQLRGERFVFWSLMNNSSSLVVTVLVVVVVVVSVLRRQRTPYTSLSSSLPLSSADGGSAELFVSETDGGKSRVTACLCCRNASEWRIKKEKAEGVYFCQQL